MHTVADLTGEESLKDLSTRSNFRLGREIAGAGGVKLVESGPLRVTAEVTPPGGVKRKVTLDSASGVLKWKCTCTSRGHVFCKHCVAAGMVTRRNAPERR